MSEARLTPSIGPDDHSAGPEDAPVTLVEYGDYQCPSCGAAHSLISALRKEFGSRLRFVFRNFPLREAHPHAMLAAEAAEAVAALGGGGAFWSMHDALYDNQSALDDEDLVRYAASAGVEPDVVRDALVDGTYRERVRADFTSGIRSGVNGTPTFFINGVRFDGDWQNHRSFASALEEAAGSGQ